jgi:hypothetical protein
VRVQPALARLEDPWATRSSRSAPVMPICLAVWESGMRATTRPPICAPIASRRSFSSCAGTVEWLTTVDGSELTQRELALQGNGLAADGRLVSALLEHEVERLLAMNEKRPPSRRRIACRQASARREELGPHGKDGKDWRSLGFARPFASLEIWLNDAVWPNSSEPARTLRRVDKLGVTWFEPSTAHQRCLTGKQKP